MLTQNESKIKDDKNDKKVELMDIYENIIEVNSNDGKIIKRRNSFTGNNLFKKMKKEKELKKNKKIINNIQKVPKQEKDIINLIDMDKNYSFSSLKLEINENNQKSDAISNKKSNSISKISELKRDKSNKSLKNNYNTNLLNEKSSNKSSFSINRNFILKSELFKKDNSYNPPREKEVKKNILFLLTNKTEAQEENQFYKLFIGSNNEDKIDFKQNNENKKNIYSNTYIDNEEEEEIKSEHNKFKNIVLNFDDKSLDEKYVLKKNLIPNYKNNEDELIQEKKLQEKVYQILKCDQSNNDIDKEINLESNINKSKLSNQNNNINLNNPIDNNKQNLIQYSIQNNYINNNFNIQSPLKYTNLNQGFYYPYMQTYPYVNNTMNPNMYQYNNQNYINPNMNINNRFNQYNNNYIQDYKNINQINNTINEKNMYNNFNNIDDEKLAKMSLNLIKSKMGFKALQNRIQTNNKFANDLLFPELKNNLTQMCCDLSGNYLIQNLIYVLSYENLNVFLTLIQENLFDICLTENGSRVIQKLLDKIYLYPLLMNKLIFSLNKKDIGILFKSAYGNHLIQKYLTIIKDNQLTNFIFIYLYKNFMDLAKSKYGVCVIQRGLSEGNEIQRKKIIELILYNLDQIMKDSFGNFIIQFIFFKLDKNKYNEIIPIIERIEVNIVDYCKNKFSSSVIEKCFEKNEIRIGERLIKCLLVDQKNEIIDILLNSYGKYVIKKAFNFENKIFRNRLINVILENLNKVKQKPEGEKIIETLKNDYPEFSFFLFPGGNKY